MGLEILARRTEAGGKLQTSEKFAAGTCGLGRCVVGDRGDWSWAGL